VNLCNGRGELLCRAGIGNIRGRLEIDIEFIWNDVTVYWSFELRIRVCSKIQYRLWQTLSTVEHTWFCGDRNLVLQSMM
jgi:hypothetical protein